MAQPASFLPNQGPLGMTACRPAIRASTPASPFSLAVQEQQAPLCISAGACPPVPQGQLRPQLAYLASLGVSRESLPQLVLARPLVLGPGIETVTSFLSRCGVPRSQLHRLLASYPLDYRVHLRVSVLGGSSAGGGMGGSSSGGRSSSGGSGL